MKMSIRNRLFITVSLLIVFFVAFSWLMNTTYLEKYYVNENRRQLLATSAAIDYGYSGDVEDLYQQLNKLERVSGVNILILDQDLSVKYYSLGAGNVVPAGPDRKRMHQTDLFIPLVSSYLTELRSGSKVIAVSQDPNLESGLLNVLSQLNNGDYLLLSKSLVSLGQSAELANRYFLLTGLLTILLSSLVIYFFSRRFTEPILRLNAIAQKMVQLDFSQKYAAPHQDELGQLGHSINSLSDQLDKSISELQATNLKLQQEIEQERKIDEMRKQFISNVSHELKTPIALIQGYAEGLKDNVVQDNAGKEYYCEVIADETSKMDKMVMDLLDLSQIESGYLNLQKEVFDLFLLVRQMVAKYELLFKDGRIRLMGDLQQVEHWVYADQTRIEQVMTNYLNNAMYHVDEYREIMVRLEKQANKVRVTVFNTGLPIPQEEQKKIFDSFYKVDKARTRADGGTGLGLSIVRAIMELHTNRYGTQNVSGGVEFWFELDRVELA